MIEEPKEMSETPALSQTESLSAKDSECSDAERSDSESDNAEGSAHNGDEMQESWDETKTKKCIAINPRKKIRGGGGNGPVIISYELLSKHFHESLDAATAKIGISKTTMKAACRRLGIVKWPYAHKGPRRRRSKTSKEGSSSSTPSASQTPSISLGQIDIKLPLSSVSMTGPTDFLKELSATSLHSLSMKAAQMPFAQPSLDLSARNPYSLTAVMPTPEPLSSSFNTSLGNSLANFLSKSESEFLFGCAASAMNGPSTSAAFSATPVAFPAAPAPAFSASPAPAPVAPFHQSMAPSFQQISPSNKLSCGIAPALTPSLLSDTDLQWLSGLVSQRQSSSTGFPSLRA
mmetsp:Transcript_12380/g.28519  ORF Transcript_12380/g.28519 Transcript_12380/m.28519 type:complete len:347 (-) Transcript_12380:60-1100(-)